jgi:hypothetical protein
MQRKLARKDRRTAAIEVATLILVPLAIIDLASRYLPTPWNWVATLSISGGFAGLLLWLYVIPEIQVNMKPRRDERFFFVVNCIMVVLAVTEFWMTGYESGIGKGIEVINGIESGICKIFDICSQLQGYPLAVPSPLLIYTSLVVGAVGIVLATLGFSLIAYSRGFRAASKERQEASQLSRPRYV